MVLIDELMYPSGSDSASISQTPQIERVEFIGDAGGSTTNRPQGILEDVAQSEPSEEAQVTSGDSVSTGTVTPHQPDQLLNAELWGTRMSLPSAEAVAGYLAPDRSPYIVCDPQFGIEGITA